MTERVHKYVIALGSNMRSARFGPPRQVVREALRQVATAGTDVLASSAIMRSRPIGPSQRDFANAAALVASRLAPLDMLTMLQDVERRFGRKRRGQAWGRRVLDLDIILWSGGIFAAPMLQIPHPAFRERDFALVPASEIAGDWHDPVTGLSVRQLNARLTRARTLPR